MLRVALLAALAAAARASDFLVAHDTDCVDYGQAYGYCQNGAGFDASDAPSADVTAALGCASGMSVAACEANCVAAGGTTFAVIANGGATTDVCECYAGCETGTATYAGYDYYYKDGGGL